MGSLTRTTCKAILLVSQPPREEVGWLIGMGEPATDNWWVDGLSQALSKVIAVSLRLGSLLLGTQRASWYSRMANERTKVGSFDLVGWKNAAKVSVAGQSSEPGPQSLSSFNWGFRVKDDLGGGGAAAGLLQAQAHGVRSALINASS